MVLLQRIYGFVAADRRNIIVRALDDQFTDCLSHSDSGGMAHRQNQSQASDSFRLGVSNTESELLDVPEVFIDQFNLVGVPEFLGDSKVGVGLDRPAAVQD